MAILQRDTLDELARWEPFRSIERLQQEMNHLFERLMPEDDGNGRSLGFIPSAELEETDSQILLKVEIPGMDAKDLDVEVTESAVMVKGERKSESKTEDKGVVRSEFHYGTFERVIALPAPIQTTNLEATYENGLLTLTLPKANTEARQPVKINLG